MSERGLHMGHAEMLDVRWMADNRDQPDALYHSWPRSRRKRRGKRRDDERATQCRGTARDGEPTP
jgi:hypothetical protein